MLELHEKCIIEATCKDCYYLVYESNSVNAFKGFKNIYTHTNIFKKQQQTLTCRGRERIRGREHTFTPNTNPYQSVASQ